jgi:hypothetical protein
MSRREKPPSRPTENGLGNTIPWTLSCLRRLRLTSDLWPPDYEFKKDRPPLIWNEELSIATTLILFAITSDSDRHRPTTN